MMNALMNHKLSFSRYEVSRGVINATATGHYQTNTRLLTRLHFAPQSLFLLYSFVLDTQNAHLQ